MAAELWVRIGSEVKGPFPPERIFEATLLGKLSRDTLISADRVTWRSIADEWGTLVDEPPAAAARVPAAPPPATQRPTSHRPTAHRPTAHRAVRAEETPTRRRSTQGGPAPSSAHPSVRGRSRDRGEADEATASRRDRGHGETRGPIRPRPPTALLASAAVGVLAIIVGGIYLATKGVRGGAPASRPSAAPEVAVKGASPRRKPAVGGPRTPQDLMQAAEGSVALLRDASSSGTGFVVADGILVTCAHVVRPMVPTLMQVVFPSVGRTEHKVVSLLYIDDTRDIAVLSIRGGRPSLELSSSSQPARGEEVLVIGNPGVGPDLIVENALARGLVGPEVVIGGSAFFQLSASVNPGNSGGPVLRSDGTLLGMVSKKATHQEGMAFAVPVRLIEMALLSAREAQPDAVARLNEDQLAQALYRQLDAAGRAYCLALGAYLQGLRRALAAGADTIESAQPYLPDLKTELRRVESTAAKHLGTFGQVLETTTWRDPVIGEELSSFQDVLNTLRTRAHVNDVLGIVVNLERADKAMGDFIKLSKSLRVRLQVPEDED